MSRQQLRRTRLLQLEREQRLEDEQGLYMTKEQRQSLLDSFMSVKFEFHDLDGLRWTQTALRRQQQTRRPTILPTNSSHRPRHQLTGYDGDATIRISTKKRRNIVISPLGPWKHEPKLTSSFLKVPSTHVKQTTSTFGNGLGLVCPTAPRFDTGFFYNPTSPTWTSQAY